jgi:hypothetical protein
VNIKEYPLLYLPVFLEEEEPNFSMLFVSSCKTTSCHNTSLEPGVLAHFCVPAIQKAEIEDGNLKLSWAKVHRGPISKPSWAW